jgi:hypothetical protein
MKEKLLLFTLLSCFAGFAAAPPKTDPPKQETTTPAKTSPSIIHVTYVCKYHSDVEYGPNASGVTVHPGDYLMVKIAKTDLDSAKRNFKDYRLWIDGICFPDLEPRFINESEPGIIFLIERDTAQNSPWQLMYTYPSYLSFHRKVDVNLGTKTTEYRIPGVEHPITLYTSTNWVPWVFYPLFLLLLILIVRYGKALLKDVSLYTSNGVIIGYTRAQPTNAAAGVINISEVPYSLGRFQFLVWLLVVFFGILHIWIITDVLSSPSGSTLFLIGISGGTFYISKLLDKPSANNAQTGPETVAAFIANNQKSQGLLYDILSDGNSISLHRLQLVLFTVFLASYFVLEVINNLIMPQFDQTMLTLMGISSATYAGIKTTES